MKARLQAPAKINLGLRVIGKMTDGWHRIESVIGRIDLADEVTLVLDRDGSSVSCAVELSPELQAHFASCGRGGVSGTTRGAAGVAMPGSADSALPAGEQNLAARAAALFLQRADVRCGVDIRLLKRVPWAAGLGGGSSDAATVLRALREELVPRMTEQQLIEIAAEIGSDVPAFIPRANTVLARGRGELITTLVPDAGCTLYDRPLLIVKPPLPSPTALAYSRFGLPADPAEDEQRRFVAATGALSKESAQTLRTLRLKVREHCFLSSKRQLTNVGSDAISEVPEGPRNGAESAPFPSTPVLINDFERVVMDQEPHLRSTAAHLTQLGAEHVMLAGSGSALVAWFAHEGEAQRAFELLTSNSEAGGDDRGRTATPYAESANAVRDGGRNDSMRSRYPAVSARVVSSGGVVTHGTFVVIARLLN